MPDLITICVPTYRRPSLLLHALHSCLIQDHRPLEIDVGDDSPATDSEVLAASLEVPKGISLRYTRNAPGLGQAGNVNKLLANARGKAIVLLHDDDVLLPGAVAAMDAALDRSRGVVAVYGVQEIIAENGELDAVKSEALNKRYRRSPEYVGVQSDSIISAFWRQFPNDGYLIDAVTARAVGFRPFDEVGEACDTDFSLRVALGASRGAFALIGSTTSRYRLSQIALSGSRDISWRFYDYLTQLDPGFTSAQLQARNELIRQIAVQSLVENAASGRRRAAIKILTSGHYPFNQKLTPIKLMYHLGLIAAPQLDVVRRRSRRPIK